MNQSILTINPSVMTPYYMAAEPFLAFRERVNRLDEKANRNNNPLFSQVSSDNFELKNQQTGLNEQNSSVLDFFKSTPGESILLLSGVIPMTRRNQSVFKKIEEGNEEGAAVQVGVSLLNLPSDITQMAYAGREIKNIYANGGPKGLPKRVYQREMPFIKGTPVEGLAKKYKWLGNADKTLFETGIGKKIRDICKIKHNPDTDMIQIKGCFSNNLKAIKTTGNSFQKIVNRTLLRTSVLGAITTSLLELPAIIKSVTKTKGSTADKAKALGIQLIKSGAYVGLITAGVSIGGAVLFPYGVVAELAGMAIGSAVAMTASNGINKKVNKLFNKELHEH